MLLKMSSAKWRQFYLSLNVLMPTYFKNIPIKLLCIFFCKQSGMHTQINLCIHQISHIIIFCNHTMQHGVKMVLQRRLQIPESIFCSQLFPSKLSHPSQMLMIRTMAMKMDMLYHHVVHKHTSYTYKYSLLLTSSGAKSLSKLIIEKNHWHGFVYH